VAKKEPFSPQSSEGFYFWTMHETILLEKVGGLAIVKLNRPEKYNSFTREMALLLQKHLADCAADPEVRCVVLTATGKGFCAGQDLGEVSDPATVDFEDILDTLYNPIVRLLRTMEKPVITAINGVAAGAGANLALAGDIVVAAQSASFVQAFSKISLIPDCGGTYFLPRIVGPQRALALAMTADKVTAPEAQQMGLVYRVFEDDQFEEGWRALGEKMAAMPTRALALTKQLINESLSNTLEEQLQAEKEAQVAAGKYNDFAEGVNAFLEKRQPVFVGR
jgi:2-(1,2-epoxy-1,2-dihydrophenyl)acetyl-CoA isomerase